MMNINDLKFRLAYWLVNFLDKHKEVHFMNFGYSDPEENHILDSSDEGNRYSIQLYKHLVDYIDLKGKDVVEIGSGRGGGLSYIARNYPAKSYIGVDLDKGAIAFSNKNNKLENLSFRKGNAELIPLDNESCDVLLNVESSHRYLNMENFLNEVNRILKKGGHFLFTDFRYDHEWENTESLFSKYNLKILREKDTTLNVLKALELNDHRSRELINRLVPGFLRGSMLNFAGAVDSETYNFFSTRKYIYRSYIFQKF